MEEFTKWDGEALAQGAADLRAANRGIQDELGDLETALEAKLDQWTGDAPAAYWAAKDEWQRVTEQLNGILFKLGSTVDSIQEQYLATERANAAMFAPR